MAYQHQTCLKDQNQGHDLPTAMYLGPDGFHLRDSIQISWYG